MHLTKRSFFFCLGFLFLCSLISVFLYDLIRFNSERNFYVNKYKTVKATGYNCHYYVNGYRYDGLKYKNDMPVFNVNGRDFVHPTIALQVGLEKISSLCNGHNEFLIRDLKAYAKEILSLALHYKDQDQEYTYLPIRFSNKDYVDVGSVWYSSLTQGQALSFFSRLYLLTNEKQYLIAAKGFYNAMMRSGGMSEDRNGSLYFQEVLVKPNTDILNGHIFASWGLNDYCQASKKIEACQAYAASEKATKIMYAKYVNKIWSFYDNPSYGVAGFAHVGYQMLHAKQARSMYFLTGDLFYLEKANTLENSLDSSASTLWYVFFRMPFRLIRLFKETAFGYKAIPVPVND